MEALRHDPVGRRTLKAAFERGWSPRRFEGWAPRKTTVIDRDSEGRAVRLTTTQEPEWNDEDRAAIAALLDLEADQCHGCGQPMSESLIGDPSKVAADAAAYFKAHPDARYLAGFSVCAACLASGKARRAQAKRDEKVDQVIEEARHWTIFTNPTPTGDPA